MANLENNPALALQLTGRDLRNAHKPVVYVWRRDAKVMYIGSSIVGMARVYDANHHRLCYATRPEDEVLVFCTADVRGTERRWIAEMKPELNRRQIDQALHLRLLGGESPCNRVRLYHPDGV